MSYDIVENTLSANVVRDRLADEHVMTNTLAARSSRSFSPTLTTTSTRSAVETFHRHVIREGILQGTHCRMSDLCRVRMRFDTVS